jgi:hypothetical protein
MCCVNTQVGQVKCAELHQDSNSPKLFSYLLTSPVCHILLHSDYIELMYHMSWDYHVVMTSLVPDYSTTFHTTSHSDSYYYRD